MAVRVFIHPDSGKLPAVVAAPLPCGSADRLHGQVFVNMRKKAQ
ncbi:MULTISPECIES: hypothetical protein [Cohnella]|nr:MULTISPECIES: hypothetical protein [Cohnella]